MMSGITMENDKCASLTGLLEVIDKLVGPDGCPWDKVQTSTTLADYVIEESHELVEAIRSGKIGDIAEELGDVFFLLLFIASYYEKQGTFTLSEVLDGNKRKMIRRHPHVFAGAHFDNMAEQLKAWEAVKKEEHAETGAPSGLYDSLPASLPPLIKAYRIHSKAARAGFTWDTDEDVEQQVESEWLEWLDASQDDDEAAQKHELGDMFFSLVEVGRRKGIKANEALDMANRRFLARFAKMEDFARKDGKEFADLSLEEKNTLWDMAKEEEKQSGGDQE